nr:hypothetical protein [uncultured Cohaesibacter sp.]
MQIVDIGYTVRDQRHCVAGHHETVGACRVKEKAVGVVTARVTNEDTDIGSGDLRRRNARLLQSLPDKHQQKALLRIHLHGFTRRHRKDARIECPDIIKNPSAEGVGLAFLTGQRVQIPKCRKTIWSDFTNTASPGNQQIPEFCHAVGTWQATSAPNYFYGLFIHIVFAFLLSRSRRHNTSHKVSQNFKHQLPKRS